ncbi:MAG: hypothetical protein WAW88_17265, partial [Nocardioides sp.]
MSGEFTEDNQLLCWTLPVAAGDVLHVDFKGSSYAPYLENAAGERCSLYMANCLVTGSGPFSVNVSGFVGPYQIKVYRLFGDSGCQPLTLSSFGAAAGVLSGSFAGGESRCHSAALGAGPHLLTFESTNYEFRGQLISSSGNVVCETPTEICIVPAAGDYALVVESLERYPGPDVATYASRFIKLAEQSGCRSGLATSWLDQPVAVSPLQKQQIDCHFLEGSPGERVAAGADTGISEASGKHLIVDATGQPACLEQTGRLGCPLVGVAPFRLITWAQHQHHIGLIDHYNVVSRPVGVESDCPAGGFLPFGEAPTSGVSGCLKVSGGSPAIITAADRDTGRLRDVTTYDVDGRAVQGLSNPGSYYLVTSLFPTDSVIGVYRPAQTTGCTRSGLDLRTNTGTLLPGELSCVELGEAVGGYVRFLRFVPAQRDYDVWVRIFDSTGALVCGGDLGLNAAEVCPVAGPGPYRAVLGDGRAQTYQVAFLDDAGALGCPELPISGRQVDFEATAFAQCFAIPVESQPTGYEWFFADALNDPGADGGLVGFGPGERRCGSGYADRPPNTICASTDSDYTVVFWNADGPTSYRLYRRQYSDQLTNLIAPEIIGRPRVDETLSLDPGLWSEYVARSTYQWFAGGEPIAGAIGPQLRVPASALGKRISVRVTGYTWNDEQASASAVVGSSVQVGSAAVNLQRPSISKPVKVG